MNSNADFQFTIGIDDTEFNQKTDKIQNTIKQVYGKIHQSLPTVSLENTLLNTPTNSSDIQPPNNIQASIPESSQVNNILSVGKEARSMFGILEKGAESIGRKLSSSLKKAITSGKFDFRDFAGSAVDILGNVLSSVSSNIIGSLFQGAGGGLGSIFGGGLGSIFGGFFASGGVAPASKISVVGEKGPELIIPNSPTRVLSHTDTLNALGSPSNQLNQVSITIHAADSQSVENMLQKPESQRLISQFALKAVQKQSNKSLNRSSFE